MEAKVIEKFWNNVDKTNGCWLWKGTLANYIPAINIGTPSKRYNPRKISLELAGKTILTCPIKPLICKNRSCVNPDHLVQGDEARFWAYVQKLSEENGGCWVWTGTITQSGYGRHHIHRNGKEFGIRAHVYSWQLYIGRPIPKSMVVCHKCDKPYCVNPDHLYIGTNDDNSKDMVAKGRSARGEKNCKAKTTAEEVKEIRYLYKKGYSYKEIGELYSLSRRNTSKIIRRTIWKHVV